MHEVKVPDHVDILVTFGNGAVAHMRFSSITALGPASEAWIFGTNGTLRLEADARRPSKQIAHGECSFACSLHQLPIRERHRRHIRLHSTRHYISFGP